MNAQRSGIPVFRIPHSIVPPVVFAHLCASVAPWFTVIFPEPLSTPERAELVRPDLPRCWFPAGAGAGNAELESPRKKLVFGVGVGAHGVLGANPFSNSATEGTDPLNALGSESTSLVT